MRASSTAADELRLSGPLTKGSAGAFTLDLLNASVGLTPVTETLLTFASTNFSLSDFTLQLPMDVTGTLAFNANKTALEIENLVDPPTGQSLPSSSGDSGAPANAGIDVANATPTPEPSSAALMLLGTGLLFGRRCRTRRER